MEEFEQLIKKSSDILENALKNKKISQKRYEHSKCVAQMAHSLSKKHKCDEKTQKYAICCGFVHDILKDYDNSLLLQMAEEYGIIMSSEQIKSPALYHSLVGGEYLNQQYSICSEICQAVKYHTSAKANMSMLEKIVFVADAISVDRKYKDREMYEKLCFENLDKGLFEILKFTVRDICRKNGYLCKDTVYAYNYYLDKELS